MRRTMLCLALFTMLLTAAATFAQPVAVRSDVPFEFTVNGTTLPAGSYEIRNIGKFHDLVQVRNLTTGEFAIARTMPSEKEVRSSHLVFAEVGNQRILRAVATAGEGYVDLGTSAAERKVLQAARETTVGLK